MTNLAIKNFPDELHKQLKDAAHAGRRSLNGFIIQALQRTAKERARRKRMRKGWTEYLKFRSTLRKLGSSADLIREDRNQLH